MTDQKGAVAGQPHNKIHQGHISPTNPKASVSVPARQPRNADELPQEIEGIRVVMRPKKVRTIPGFYQSEIAQMTQEEYAANQDAILFAQAHNLVVDDVTPPEVLEARDRAMQASGQKLLDAIKLRDARLDVDRTFKDSQAARAEYERVKDDPYQSLAAEKKMHDASDAFTEANKALKGLQSSDQ